jgi:hypothetical protein
MLFFATRRHRLPRLPNFPAVPLDLPMPLFFRCYPAVLFLTRLPEIKDFRAGGVPAR